MAEIDQSEYRRVLGCYPTGVTVVTTLCAEGPLGMTVNSFASVSLEPPLVLWSPARKSARFPAFEAASHFAVHVLAADQRELAERFAKDGLDFEGLAWAEGIAGLPVFDGCAARLECLHAAQYDGGDHLICVGEVLRMAQADKAPLVYFRGGFAALA